MTTELRELVRSLLERFQREAMLRDKVVKLSREVIALSRSVVVSVHSKNYAECEENIAKLRTVVDEFVKEAQCGEKLYYSGIVRDTLAEYVEAVQFYSLVRGGRYVKHEDLKVPSSSYVLGLLDVVGELRRFLLDSLKDGNIEEAERALNYMEEIYSSICLLNIPDAVLPGYRRKCDLARQLIERSKSELVYVKATVSVTTSLTKLIKEG